MIKNLYNNKKKENERKKLCKETKAKSIKTRNKIEEQSKKEPHKGMFKIQQ